MQPKNVIKEAPSIQNLNQIRRKVWRRKVRMNYDLPLTLTLSCMHCEFKKSLCNNEYLVSFDLVLPKQNRRTCVKSYRTCHREKYRSLMNRLALYQVCVSYIQHVTENAHAYKSSLTAGFAKQIMPIPSQATWQLSHFNARKLNRRQV